MTPQKILSEVRCQVQYQYRIKLEMSNNHYSVSVLENLAFSARVKSEMVSRDRTNVDTTMTTVLF